MNCFLLILLFSSLAFAAPVTRTQADMVRIHRRQYSGYRLKAEDLMDRLKDNGPQDLKADQFIAYNLFTIAGSSQGLTSSLLDVLNLEAETRGKDEASARALEAIRDQIAVRIVEGCMEFLTPLKLMLSHARDPALRELTETMINIETNNIQWYLENTDWIRSSVAPASRAKAPVPKPGTANPID